MRKLAFELPVTAFQVGEAQEAANI
jgi:hypothetical protein